VDRPKLFTNSKYLETERRWPPKAVKAMKKFQNLTS